MCEQALGAQTLWLKYAMLCTQFCKVVHQDGIRFLPICGRCRQVVNVQLKILWVLLDTNNGPCCYNSLGVPIERMYMCCL